MVCPTVPICELLGVLPDDDVIGDDTVLTVPVVVLLTAAPSNTKKPIQLQSRKPITPRTIQSQRRDAFF